MYQGPSWINVVWFSKVKKLREIPAPPDGSTQVTKLAVFPCHTVCRIAGRMQNATAIINAVVGCWHFAETKRMKQADASRVSKPAKMVNPCSCPIVSGTKLSTI